MLQQFKPHMQGKYMLVMPDINNMVATSTGTVELSTQGWTVCACGMTKKVPLCLPFHYITLLLGKVRQEQLTFLLVGLHSQ